MHCRARAATTSTAATASVTDGSPQDVEERIIKSMTGSKWSVLRELLWQLCSLPESDPLVVQERPRRTRRKLMSVELCGNRVHCSTEFDRPPAPGEQQEAPVAAHGALSGLPAPVLDLVR
mmetsp:Transcript_17934/g.53893  ORF Transcript_17934/g.53893 Transcript_17934/m.53893 type:complete len:120 (-) Transcript_17934:455-814(-)